MKTINKTTFTLIELLVVVAIIGILVSILMPSLNKAKLKAKRVVCMSSLSQSAKIMFFFANDNSTKFYQIGQNTWQWTNTDKGKMFDGYANYAGDSIYEIWGCPMFSDRPNASSHYTNHTHMAGAKIFYGAERFSPLSISEQNSSTVLVQDLIYFYSNKWRSVHSSSKKWDPWNVKGYVFTRDATPHGANIAYGDGHAKWLSISQLEFITLNQSSDIWSTPPE